MNLRYLTAGLILVTASASGAWQAPPDRGADGSFAPARLVQAETPPLSPLAVGWTSTVAVALVDASGTVARVSGDSLTEDVEQVVRRWQFRPASVGRQPVASPVLVIGLFRPPSIRDATKPPDVVRLTAPLAGDTPRPVNGPAPPYPPRGTGSGVAIVEILVGEDGRPHEVRIAASAGGFDSVALDTARQWSFRPARRDGEAVAGTVCLIFGFRQPVV
ncbi:MAG TPA: energy transducer TonB [Vicinamibacterales bacterium]|nr:energy transducer TonB [Vicinamibacterales bacterium]